MSKRKPSEKKEKCVWRRNPYRIAHMYRISPLPMRGWKRQTERKRERESERGWREGGIQSRRSVRGEKRQRRVGKTQRDRYIGKKTIFVEEMGLQTAGVLPGTCCSSLLDLFELLAYRPSSGLRLLAISSRWLPVLVRIVLYSSDDSLLGCLQIAPGRKEIKKLFFSLITREGGGRKGVFWFCTFKHKNIPPSPLPSSVLNLVPLC